MSAYDAKIRIPCCVLGIRASDQALSGIAFLPLSQRELAPRNAMAERASKQLLRYLDDARFAFDLPLQPTGTVFQRGVWRCISAIPAGATATYGDIARELSSAPRAVGQACGGNPYPVIVPCHRVVAAAGLGGFAHRDEGFMLSVKRWLLAHEA